MRLPSPVPALVLAALVLGACGGPARTAGYATLRTACPNGQIWHDGACRTPGPAEAEIDRAIALIDEARFEEGLATLEKAASLGPHLYRTFVRLHEQLGMASAFVENAAKAKSAFRTMIAAAPTHQVSYDTSPKALFELEKVRAVADKEPRTQIAVRLPSELNVERPIPIDVEVLGDPLKLLARATLLVSTREKPTARAVDLSLPGTGQSTRVTLPPTGGDGPDMLRLHLVGYDKSGNQVLLWESGERPREVSLAFTPRVPWYKKWWVWATVGSVVGISTGVTVYLVTREPPDEVGGSFGTARP